MDAQEVSAWILQHATTKDLAEIATSINGRRERIGQEAKWTFKVGDVVSFKPRKTMPAFTGTITNIAQKNAVVRTERGRYGTPESWRMPFDMLTKVEAEPETFAQLGAAVFNNR